MSRPTFGLALGSGGARGSAHVGVLKALEEHGLVPDVIVGSSMGAQVGGAFAAGIPSDTLISQWQTASFARLVKTLLPTIPWGGWSSGTEISRMMHRLVGEVRIEDLPITFAAVATDLQTGRPHVLTEGSLVQAIRASLSVPGLFTPVWVDGHLLIDGGVTDPLPVDVTRSLGADVVAAVDVLVCPEDVPLTGLPAFGQGERLLGIVKRLSEGNGMDNGDRRFHPNVFSVLFQMSTVFQKRVSELGLRIQPPDVLIRPDFSSDPPCYSDVGGGIEAGRRAAEEALPAIRECLG
ncbi:MAG: patatin-like phospholipase family protein [Candidatus Bipolaricaulota bacterium]|nr:MAG: patatin-like phospholipase family protein [Candidatus Bipolaricaulota bacterium]